MLLVSPKYATYYEANICTGQTFPFGGQLLNMSGTYVDTFIAAGGCDSIVTLTLQVDDVLQTTLADTICQGDTYDFNGQILSIAGTYSQTLASQAGCDSVVTLTLTVTNPVDSTINEEICMGEVFNFAGQLLSSSGTFVDTLISTAGCDSIVTLNLLVHPIPQSQMHTTICAGTSVTFGGQNLSTTGTYTDTLATLTGCDSIVTLNLNVNPLDTTNLEITICTGSSYDFQGTILSVPGIYSETITSSAGCDSTLILNLQILDQNTNDITAQICLGQSYPFGNSVLSTSGTYVDSLTSSFGCDSIVTLILEVLEQLQTALTDTICQGVTYDFNGQILSASGTYSVVLSTAQGCDSLITLELTILPNSQTDLAEDICIGETYDFNGAT